MSIQKARVGVIGTGLIIHDYHLPVLLANERAEVVAAGNLRAPSLEALAREFGIPKTYTDLDLMAEDPEKDRFLTGVMRTQMRAAVHAAFRDGWLQLAFLEVGGVKAAGYLNFDYDGHIWVYNSGINFEYGAISPGWVLLGHLLKWANENQRAAFDFMRGDEPYKYRFGGIDRFVMRVTVRR